MQMSEILDRIERISESRGDPEAAHGMEDELYREFIRYVAASGTPDLREKAKEILTVDELNFPRWRA